MVSLKRALKLVGLKKEDDIVYIRPKDAGKFDGNYFTLEEIKNTFDIKNRKVTSITARLDSGGNYCSMEFEII